MTPRRALVATGRWGAILTLVILAMSVLMRLGTRIDDGQAVSLLAPGVEVAARIAHRIAAMAVGALAAWALVAGWQARPLPRATTGAIAGVVGLTLMLAMIGRLTPGYRLDAVTVANVVGGIALAAAFWWLHAGAAEAPRGDGLAAVALALLLGLAALGAGADAAAMRGESAFFSVHLGLGAAFTLVALAAAWRQRRRRAAIAVAVLCIIQLALGFLLAGARPLGLAWAHALSACVLALALVQLCAVRR